MQRAKGSEKKNAELLQSLAQRTYLQKQSIYYRNVFIVSLIAIGVSTWLKADVKWVYGLLGLFLFSAFNYFFAGAPKVPTASYRPGSSSDQSHISFTNIETSLETRTKVPAAAASSSKGVQSPLLGFGRKLTHGVPISSPVLRSPNFLQSQENYDLNSAKKLAMQAVQNSQSKGDSKSLSGPFTPNSPFPSQGFPPLSGNAYRSPLLNPRGATGGVGGGYPSVEGVVPRDYQVSPLTHKPLPSNAIQHKDALQSLGLTQIPDEWIDELRLILGKHLHLIMEIYNQSRTEVIQVLKKAMMVPPQQGGISERDFQQALLLLDYADQDRTEKLENGHPVTLKSLLEYVRKTNLIANIDDFINQWEFALSFFRCCQSIIHQKQQNIQKVQELERMKHDIIDDSHLSQQQSDPLSYPGENSTQNMDRRRGMIIEKLQQLVNSSYEKRLIIQWRHMQSSIFSGIKFDSFFAGNSNSNYDSLHLMGKEAFITDQEIVLALFLHRCNHLSQTMFTGTMNLRWKTSTSTSTSSLFSPGGSNPSTTTTTATTTTTDPTSTSFSDDHLIFNYTIDLYRMIQLLQARNREDERHRLTFATQEGGSTTRRSGNNNSSYEDSTTNEEDDYDIDVNDKAIIAFIYHTPMTFTTGAENLSPNPMMSMMRGSPAPVSSSQSSSIQDYIHNIKNPHFDIIKLSANGKKREIYKIDYTRNDCYESIIIFLLITYMTTLFHYYHYDPSVYSNIEDMIEQLLLKESLFEDDEDGSEGIHKSQQQSYYSDHRWQLPRFTTSMWMDGSRCISDVCNQRDFRLVKSMIEKMIPKTDLRHIFLRFYQQTILMTSATTAMAAMNPMPTTMMNASGLNTSGSSMLGSSNFMNTSHYYRPGY